MAFHKGTQGARRCTASFQGEGASTRGLWGGHKHLALAFAKGQKKDGFSSERDKKTFISGVNSKKKKKVKQFTLAFGSHSKQCFIIRGFCQGRNVRNLRHQCLLIGCPHTRGKRTKHLGKLETI